MSKFKDSSEQGCSVCGKVGRHAAGQDPAKRDQILDGAQRVFTAKGFDAASMNDITREANVSKGTIYVYFENKEELFEALIDRERSHLFDNLPGLLGGDGSTAEKLRRYGAALTRLITSDPVMRAQRIVIAMAERKPELGARFYAQGPQRGKALLVQFLQDEVTAGRLAIEDAELAAFQFAEMCMAGIFRRRLFAHMSAPPTAEEIARSVEGAVTVFMRAYAPLERD